MSSSVAESGGTTPVPASKSDGLWVLVPREPTQEMILKGLIGLCTEINRVHPRKHFTEGQRQGTEPISDEENADHYMNLGAIMRTGEEVRAAYRAMLAVAAVEASPRQVAGDISREQVPSTTEGWRTIESAPRDGTSILVGHAKAVFDAYWDEGAAGWVNGVTSGYDDDLVTYEPTHWQPLPSPPSEQVEGKTGSSSASVPAPVCPDGLDAQHSAGRDDPSECEYFEALSDLVDLQNEADALSGGGPNWGRRWTVALERAQELTRREP